MRILGPIQKKNVYLYFFYEKKKIRGGGGRPGKNHFLLTLKFWECTFGGKNT